VEIEKYEIGSLRIVKYEIGSLRIVENREGMENESKD